MRLDPFGTVQVDPDNTTVLENTNLDIALTIPPNTVKNEDGSDYTGPLSISIVPSEFTPASLPDNLGPSLVISVQPMGLTFAQPAPITFPNINDLDPGSEVNIWSLDHSTGQFFVAGRGEVSADGSVINTIQGGIREASWHFPLPDWPEFNRDEDNNSEYCDECKKARQSIGSGFDISTGNFYDDYTLPSYRSLGVLRGLTLNYNSISAFPSTIITTQTDLPPTTSKPDYMIANIIVGGVARDPIYREAISDRSRFGVFFDAANLDTGFYPYTFNIASHYPTFIINIRCWDRVRFEWRICARDIGPTFVSGSTSDKFLINNEINSPFGSGWTLEGLSRLHFQDGISNDAILTEGNGSILRFKGPFQRNFPKEFSGTLSFSSRQSLLPEKEEEEVTPFPFSFSVGDGGAQSEAVGDFNKDGTPDLAVLGFDGNVSILLGDGTGSFSEPSRFFIGNDLPFRVAVADLNEDGNQDLAGKEKRDR